MLRHALHCAFARLHKDTKLHSQIVPFTAWVIVNKLLKISGQALGGLASFIGPSNTVTHRFSKLL